MATKRLSRREALIHLGVGAAGLLALPRGAGAATAPESASANTAPEDASGTTAPDLEDLANSIRAASREGAFDVAARAIVNGAGYGDLLGAAFMAGVHDVRPRSVGGKLHCVMMVDSAFQLVEAAPAREAWLAALWSVDDFKRSQERDRQEAGDWVLPPAPAVSFTGPEQARRELVAAMDTWDAERADRAIVGALRSLVNGLLYRRTSISDSEIEVFEHAGELAAELPAGWLRGTEEPAQSESLLRALRGSDAREAQKLVVAAFRDGLGPQTVWDGLRLYASELFHRRPKSAARRHGPVHGVTEVNAFAYVWRTTGEETTKRLMILQAAGWLPLMRHSLDGFFGAQQGPYLDALGAPGEEALPSMEEVFEQPSPAAARSLIDRRPGGAEAFMARLRGHLLERAFQSHQYKYAAAIAEESALVHPRWTSRILAPAVTYTPVPADPETETYERSRLALRKAGVA
ncbi:MAG: hypothetical protein GY719_28730 [bacterium]|nr:hypothetical protein [bacterium]